MTFDYGPLTMLIQDTSISEIMVNAYDRIFIEHNGVLIQTENRFNDEQALKTLLTNILKAENRQLEIGVLNYDGVMPNGDRYNMVLPPMSRYLYLTIRKNLNRKWTLRELVDYQSITADAAKFLNQAVKEKKNIIVSGGSGAGKTTLLQALASGINPNERILTIEDVPEIFIGHRNWISLLAVRDSHQPVTIRDCVVNALRMRPDRILVGECRRDEAFDMLQAMNSGHEGSMTTIHANSPTECLIRLENLLYMSKVDIPLKALRAQIARSVQFIVQIKREASGKRKVTEIIELTGMEGDVITKASIFALNDKAQLNPTGYISRYIR